MDTYKWLNARIRDGEVSISGFTYGTPAVRNLRIPGTYLGLPVTAIDEWAFTMSADIQEVIIPDSVRELHAKAFYDCRALARVYLPQGLRMIGDFAFFRCTALTQIDLPDSMGWLGSYCFASSGLTSIKLPSGIGEPTDYGLPGVPDYCFHNCEHLEQVIIPEGIKQIGTSAFQGCRELKEIILPESLTELGVGAFSGCASLRQLRIPPKVQTICPGTFEGCTALEKLLVSRETCLAVDAVPRETCLALDVARELTERHEV